MVEPLVVRCSDVVFTALTPVSGMTNMWQRIVAEVTGCPHAVSDMSPDRLYLVMPFLAMSYVQPQNMLASISTVYDRNSGLAKIPASNIEGILSAKEVKDARAMGWIRWLVGSERFFGAYVVGKDKRATSWARLDEDELE